MARKLNITITMERALVERLDEVARQNRESRTAVMTRACEEHLAGPGQFAAAMGNPAIRSAFAQALSRPDVVRGLAAAMTDEAEPGQLRLFEQAVRAAVTGGQAATATGRSPARVGRPVVQPTSASLSRATARAKQRRG